MKPYLTKLAWGRWWVYLDTKRKHKMHSGRLLGWHFMVVSYRKVKEDEQ